MGIGDGDAYLEKIVQVPFVLPVVPKVKLLQKVIDDLNRVFGDVDEREFSTRWGNIFRDGLAPLITKPRDIVRIINALMVTFPVVRGEVNPADFIALEFLRVFVPDAYRMLRESEDRFVGVADRDRAEKRQREQAFHDEWINGLPEPQRKPVKAIVENLFPRLHGLWGGFSYGASTVGKWNAELRIASPEIFPRFFQFGVEEGALSRAELNAFIALGENVDAIADGWIEAMDRRRPDGSSKARELLNRLIEIENLDAAFVKGCLAAVFRVGDRYLDAREAIPGFFSIRPAIQVYWLLQHLFKCLPEAEREPFMIECLRSAQALAVAVTITDSVAKMLQPDAEARESVFQKFAPATLASMKTIVVDHIRAQASRACWRFQSFRLCCGAGPNGETKAKSKVGSKARSRTIRNSCGFFVSTFR
jgi:predicted KAP-like P-loop ATPase